MTPFIDDTDFTLYVGDVLAVLFELPDESVDCCVTSPPYWGLRDYGTGSWDGGDPACDHSGRQTIGDMAPANESGHRFRSSSRYLHQDEAATATVCAKCGARRVDRQIGLEATPEFYVQRIVEVFREVRRVLRKTGTCWINLGDSYASARARDRRNVVKEKDLVGVPWRVAFALQADGWFLRSDIVWSKPNPMPESVTDRPTKSHEYVFLLSKQPRYFFDQEAVREPHSPDGRLKTVHSNYDNVGNGNERWPNGGRNVRSVWEIPTQPYPEAHFATFPEELPRRAILAGCPEGGTVLDPFMGSGTVALVARRHGRRSIGIELNPEYAKLCAKRLQQLSLLAETPG